MSSAIEKESSVTTQPDGQQNAGTTDSLDRTVLPVPPPQYPPITELDAKNAKAPPRFEVKAPKGAPNVVVVLLDNMGFGDISTFGGPIQMPTLDRLAKTGTALQQSQSSAVVFAQPRRAAYRSQ